MCLQDLWIKQVKYSIKEKFWYFELFEFINFFKGILRKFFVNVLFLTMDDITQSFFYCIIFYRRTETLNNYLYK